MPKLRYLVNKLSKTQKIICLILILGLVLLLSIGIPTLARYKNRNTLVTVSTWDGSIASSYRKGTGTEEDPYIISNGSELAYLYTQLSITDYEDMYFLLNNDIVLNNGIFNYDIDNGIQYTIDGQTYYVDEYSNKYYDNIDRTGTEEGTINIFNPLNGFKGHFNGNSYRIYGLYMTNENDNEIALFTNLEGDITDLYVENSIIYGGTVTAGIATTTNNTSLNNILFNGYVVGRNKDLIKNLNINLTTPVINVHNTDSTDYINLANKVPFGSEIVSTSITGNYVINGATELETSIKLNNISISGGSFNVDLGSNILNNIPVLTSTTSQNNVTLTFSNLTYNIVYKYGISSGIVANSSNTIIQNVINKGYVYGYSTSAGLVGNTTDLLNINQSYNTGNIYSEHVSGGLIGVIERSNQSINISKSYNRGDMYASFNGGLIGVANDNSSSVIIANVFNTSTTDYSIGKVNNATVNVTNAYLLNGKTGVNEGTINGNFTSVSIDDLKTKTYVINNLSYNEFISFNDLKTNNQNVWIYEENSLPILFIDDIINPIANINVGTRSWNNLSYELSPVKFKSNITFNIESADVLKPIKEIYYYVNNSREPLSEEEILNISSWNTYTGIVQISEEGLYVVYAKIVDYNDNITYLNTDLLILDFSGSSVNIRVDNNKWENLRGSLNTIYVNKEIDFIIEAKDDLSGISVIKYYVTDEILNIDDLNGLSESSWSTYSSMTSIDEVGKYIIYAKVIDGCNFITYANTDYIVFNGYKQNSLILGRNSSSYLDVDPYITDKSTISFNFSYSESISNYTGNYTHNIISNILLPMGSKLTLIDHIKNKVYEYKITTDTDIYNYNNSCDPLDLSCTKVATIPLTLFKEVGSEINKPYIESNYYDNGIISENYTVVLDLFNTNIITNYNNILLYMELHDSNSINVRPTLYNTLKGFNIYSDISNENTNANLYLTTDYNGSGIEYNSDSTTDINITSKLNYKSINNFKIIDTTYENKEMGLSIKMVDDNGDILDKKYLKNISFKIGNKNYYPEEDNIIRINLENGIADTTKTLTIDTYDSNNDLDQGTYYFKISNYISYDGNYYDELGNVELSIPVNVSNINSNVPYSFNVNMNDENRIISKTNEEVNVVFNILQSGSLDNPNIKVSLYKKNQLTAYNQDYSIVNLSDYVNNSLNLYSNNIYNVSNNPNKNTEFQLDLITDKFENTGYKFVFELYDGIKKIGTIEKYFIVR